MVYATGFGINLIGITTIKSIMEIFMSIDEGLRKGDWDLELLSGEKVRFSLNEDTAWVKILAVLPKDSRIASMKHMR